MPSPVRTALSNSTLMTLNALLTASLNFFALFAYSRFLSPEQFGHMLSSQAKVLVWLFLADLGLYNGLIAALTWKRTHASETLNGWNLVRKILLVREAGALLGFALILGLSFLESHQAENAKEIMLTNLAFTPYLFAFALQQSITAYAHYLNRIPLAISTSLLAAIVTVSSSVWLAYTGASPAAILFMQSLGGILAVLFMLPFLHTFSKGKYLSFEWSFIFQHSWPYALVSACIMVWQRLDQIVAEKYFGYIGGGEYALAARLVAIPLLFMSAIFAALFTDFQRIGKDAPEKLLLYTSTFLKIFFRFGIFLSAAILFVVSLIMMVFFPKYLLAKTLVAYFIPGIWFYWMYHFTHGYLFGKKEYKSASFAHIAALVCYAIALLLLPKFLGVKGIVWSFDLFCFCLFLFNWIALQRKSPIYPWQKFQQNEKEILLSLRKKVLRS